MKINGMEVIGSDVKVIRNLDITRYFAILEDNSKVEVTSNEYQMIQKQFNKISNIGDCVFNGACINEYIRN